MGLEHPHRGEGVSHAEVLGRLLLVEGLGTTFVGVHDKIERFPVIFGYRRHKRDVDGGLRQLLRAEQLGKPFDFHWCSLISGEQ